MRLYWKPFIFFTKKPTTVIKVLVSQSYQTSSLHYSLDYYYYHNLLLPAATQSGEQNFAWRPFGYVIASLCPQGTAYEEAKEDSSFKIFTGSWLVSSNYLQVHYSTLSDSGLQVILIVLIVLIACGHSSLSKSLIVNCRCTLSNLLMDI